MELVLLDIFCAHRLKRAQADVQCDLRCFDSSFRHLRQDLRREMQSSRWRCHGSTFARVHSLVAIAISPTILTRNIWRQRHVPKLFDQFKEVCNWGKSDLPLPE